MAAACYCTHCQRQSGSALSINVSITKRQFHQQGETRCFVDRGDSGFAVYRDFCGDCGSPIASRVETHPDLVVIKGGTFDDRSWIKPMLEVYTDHRAPWLSPLSGCQSSAQAPDAKALAALATASGAQNDG